jgi:hypothetical protein
VGCAASRTTIARRAESQRLELQMLCATTKRGWMPHWGLEVDRQFAAVF